MLIVLFLFLFIQGLASSNDRYRLYQKRCNDILLPHYNRSIDIIPDAEEVLFRCPLTKRYIECKIMHFETEFERRFNLGDLIVVKNFWEEMCNENSQLYKVYSENIVCYRSLVNEGKGCKKIAENVYSEYRASSFAFQNTDIEELEEEEQKRITQYRVYIEPYCLKKSYLTACIGRKVLETCGSDAFGTFLRIFIGLREENHICGKKEENPFMKGFTDFLANENKTVESVMIRTMFEMDDE